MLIDNKGDEMQDAMKLVFPGGEHPQLLLDRGSYRIGSDPGAQVRLNGEGVQPEHAELQLGALGASLRIPVGSPVQVNGRTVDGLIALRPGDTLGIGAVQARLVAMQVAAAGPASALGRATDIAATAVRPVVPRYVLRAVSGGTFGRTHPLHASLSVGRADDAGLPLAGDGISRQHARLTPGDDGVMVEDLGSANGTFLNGQRVSREIARHGDEIAFDTQRFRLVVSGQPELAAPAQAAPRTSRTWWLAALLALAAVVGVALIR